MRIKRIITILIATVLLSFPAIQFKQIIKTTQDQERINKIQLSFAIVREEEARIENERVATQKALEEAETARQLQIAQEAQKATETAARNAQCGPQDPAVIYNVLIGSGVPKLSAIQLLGSWKTESGLNYCQSVGDGGLAWGLNSWHPGRRYDMPMNLNDQIIWAVHTEMKRDCSTCYETVMAGTDVWSIRSAIKQSTRWGIEGARWTYADQFSTIFL